MVFFFESQSEDLVDQPPRIIYMGKDKHENEDLIKHSEKTNLWFHVDNLSSAHLYLELLPGEDWEMLDRELLEDIGQLTKKNSIQGNKQDNITVIYTPVSNLLKNNSMDVGTVSFKKPKLVKKVFIQTKVNNIVNRLNKTKTEITTEDFKTKRMEQIQNNEKNKMKLVKEQKQREKEQEKLWQQEKMRKKTMYDDLFTEDNVELSSNDNRAQNFEEDFW